MDDIIVHMGDLRSTRRLGAAYLRTCKVARWRSRPFGRWEAEAWYVPASVIAEHGLQPLAEVDAYLARHKASQGRRKPPKACQVGHAVDARARRHLAEMAR
ncbi:hypothetical protein [Paludisphaera rhizosphaerae]|uniref:hypothetical protein n=1 Tax=Paludisphaera rhizosphaerae TaxID=2711216 RepID=UPI0013EB306A|nr:hypothetical protein [Paludisphaera rhizosphaerae]